jgi:hypothetical protein
MGVGVIVDCVLFDWLSLVLTNQNVCSADRAHTAVQPSPFTMCLLMVLWTWIRILCVYIAVLALLNKPSGLELDSNNHYRLSV